MSSLTTLLADRDAWRALPRPEKLQHITTALGVPYDAAAEEHLSTVPPGWQRSMRHRNGCREYGFPADPHEGDEHTAWDGSRWRYTGIPWWDRIDEEQD